jgi:hypothetical protein
MKKDELTYEARAEIEALAEKPEEAIRLDDIPEVADWIEGFGTNPERDWLLTKKAAGII